MQPSQQQFLSSSQVTAMVPTINSQSGPQLIQCYQYPNPTYKTIAPIMIQQNSTEVVTITFLSHNANNCNVSVSGDYFVAATVNHPFLNRLDMEAYGVDMTITGMQQGQARATIIITGCTPMVTIYVDVVVIGYPVQPLPPQVLPVATSVRSSLATSQACSQQSMHNSQIDNLTGSVKMDGSGSWRGSNMLKSSGRW